MPIQPQDLTRHDCIVFLGAAHAQTGEFTNAQGIISVKVPSRLSVSTGDAVYDAVRAGLGIAVVPSWFCRNALGDGSLIHILGEYELPPQQLFAVTLGKPPAGGKVHTFIKFAERLLKDTLTLSP